MDQGTLIMSDLNPAKILEAVRISVAQFAGSARPFASPPDYDADNVSQKVLRIVVSYTDYVNRTVWHQ